MQTVFATLPENPNVRVKVRVDSSQLENTQESIFKRHFAEIGPNTNPSGTTYQEEPPKEKQEEEGESSVKIEPKQSDFTDDSPSPPQKTPTTPEWEFIKELESNLERVLRRALSPLYTCVNQLSIALAESDAKNMYTRRDGVPYALERMQNPIVNMGQNKTFKEFFDNNGYLGNTIILYTIDLMRREMDYQFSLVILVLLEIGATGLNMHKTTRPIRLMMKV